LGVFAIHLWKGGVEVRSVYIFFAVLVLLFSAIGVSAAEPQTGVLRVSGDNTWEAYINGEEVGSGADWQQVGVYEFNLIKGSAVIAVHVHDAEAGASGSGGFLADIVLDDGTYIGTGIEGDDWKGSSDDSYLGDTEWTEPDFDDSGWDEIQIYDAFGGGIWGFGADTMRQFLKDPDCTAFWIWAGENNVTDEAFFRYTIGESFAVEPCDKCAVTWGQVKAEF
jgi:hypothetical protein